MTTGYSTQLQYCNDKMGFALDYPLVLIKRILANDNADRRKLLHYVVLFD